MNTSLSSFIKIAGATFISLLLGAMLYAAITYNSNTYKNGEAYITGQTSTGSVDSTPDGFGMKYKYQ